MTPMDRPVADGAEPSSVNAPERPWLGWFLRAGATALCFWWIGRGLDFASFWETLRQCRPGPLVWGFSITVFVGVLLGARWHQMLRAGGSSVGLPQALRLTFEAMFYGLVLPTAVGGDLYRIVQIRDTTPMELAGTTIVMERVFGLWGLCLMVLGGLLVRPDAVGTWGPVSGVTALGLLLGTSAALVPMSSRFVRRVLSAVGLVRLADVVERVAGQARGFVSDPGLVVGFVVASMVIQLMGIGSMALFAAGLGMELDLVWFVVAVPTSWILAMAPSLGGFGPREQGLVWMLAAMGQSPEHAGALVALQAVALLVRAALGGLWALLPR